MQEVKSIFSNLVSMSSFFHMSGLRSRELRDIGKSDSLQLCELPKLFEVRWSELNPSLLESVLVSWRALVNYFKTGTDQSSQGYYKYLTSIPKRAALSFSW